MKISATHKDFTISRNVHFLSLCMEIEWFLTAYQNAITNKITNKQQTDYYKKHFKDDDIIPEWTNFVSRLKEIMIDENGRKFKTRKQIKLTYIDTELIYNVFCFIFDLDSVKFKETKLQDIEYDFQLKYTHNTFYNVAGIVEDFLELYGVVNSKHMPVYND